MSENFALIGFFSLILSAPLSGCGSAPANSSAEKAKTTAPTSIQRISLPPAHSPVPIDPNAADPYTRENYPKTVRQFGILIPVINRERIDIAKIVSEDARCDAVQNVQITEGSVGDFRRYIADCANITRFFFDREAIKQGKPAHLQTQADMINNGLRDW